MLRQKISDKMRGILQIYGTSKIKQRLWDDDFTHGRWERIDKTPGDCIYPRIEKAANGGSILDLGCGSGNTANELAVDMYRDYTGVDISSAAIAKAQKRTEANCRAHKTSFLQSDIDNYVPDRQFDVILFRESIYYIRRAKIQAILERYSEWLTPEGVFIVKIWHGRKKGKGIVDIIKNRFEVIEEYWPEQTESVLLVFRGNAHRAAVALGVSPQVQIESGASVQ